MHVNFISNLNLITSNSIIILIKKILFIVIFSIFSTKVNSQDLFKREDPFTKATIVNTRFQTLYDVLLGSMSFSITKVENLYSITFSKINGDMYSIEAGGLGLILCKSGNTYNIKSIAYQTWSGYGDLRSFQHTYTIDEEALKILIEDVPVGVRFYKLNGGYDEFLIKEKRRNVIPNHIKVIMGLKIPDNS